MADAYEDFYRHYEPFVRAFIARRVPIDSIDDLVAEVFVVAWRRRGDMSASALPWLYRTARNIVGDSYRSIERLHALKQKIAAVPADAGSDPATVTADRALLCSTMAELSERDREILLLAAWEGLNPDAIGMVLGISAGSAAVRLHRARRRLERSITLYDEVAMEGQ